METGKDGGQGISRPVGDESHGVATQRARILIHLAWHSQNSALMAVFRHPTPVPRNLRSALIHHRLDRLPQRHSCHSTAQITNKSWTPPLPVNLRQPPCEALPLPADIKSITHHIAPKINSHSSVEFIFLLHSVFPGEKHDH